MATAKFWDDIDKTYACGAFGHYTSEFTQSLVELAKLQELVKWTKGPLKVLDIGAGHGAVIERLFDFLGPEMIKSVNAIDISPDMIDSLRNRIDLSEKERKKVTAEVMDAQHLAFEDASFDAVFSNFVLQFIPDRAQVLREMWRVAKPGAKVAISSWAPLEQCSLLQAHFEAVNKAKQIPPEKNLQRNNPNFALADLNQFKDEVECAGFVRAEGHRRFLEFGGNSEQWARMSETSAALKPEQRLHFQEIAREMFVNYRQNGPLVIGANIVVAQRETEWIASNTRFTSKSDERNRKREYYYSVDESGRIWRRDPDDASARHGEVRSPSIRDTIFSRLRFATESDEGEKGYSYVARVGREKYFVVALDSPVVFWDLREGEMFFGSSLRLPFDPSKLILIDDARLYHKIMIPHRPLRNDEQLVDYGLLERNLAYSLLETIREDDRGGLFITYNGVEYPLKREKALPRGVEISPPPQFDRITPTLPNSRWWKNDEN